MTSDVQAREGNPAPDLNFDAPIPALLKRVAGELTIANPGSCPSIANLTLSALIGRTSTFLKRWISGTDDAKHVALLTKGRSYL